MELDVGRVDLRFPTELLLEDVLFYDERRDTLCSLSELNVAGISRELLDGELDFRKATLMDPHFHLYVAKGDSTTNLQPLLDQFPSTNSKDSTATEIKLDRIEIQNGHFTYRDFNVENETELVDFDNLDIQGIQLEVSQFFLQDSDIDCDIERLAFTDHSGISLEHLSGGFLMRSDSIGLEAMQLTTANSNLSGNILFRHNSWSDYADFNNRVKLKGIFQPSTIDFKDIAYFGEELIGLDRSVEFEGKVRGKVNNLKARKLKIRIDDNTWFKGRMDLVGLPEIDQTFIDLSITELHAVKEELDKIPIPPFKEERILKTPDNFKQLGDIRFDGKFTGFLSDFVAFGTIQTAIGSVESDLKFLEEDDNYFYSGNLETSQFDLGKFYNNQALGRLTSAFNLVGEGLTQSDLDAEITGTVSEIEVMGYSYHNVATSGSFKQDFFNGYVDVHDPNADLDFQGLVDFTGKKPKLDFTTNVTHFNPEALNLVELGSYTSISGEFNIQSTGISLNDINGRIEGTNVLFCTAIAEYPMNQFVLDLAQNDKEKEFVLESDIASAKLTGKFDFKGLESGVTQIVADIIPHLEPPGEFQRGREDFELEINIHNFELITEVFMPELIIAPDSRFSLAMNDITDEFEATFTSNHVEWEQYYMDSLTLDISHPDEALYVTLLSDRLAINGGLLLDQFSIDLRNDADTIYTNLTWGEEGDLIRGDFIAESIINTNLDIRNKLNYVNLWMGDTEWSLQDTARIDYLGDRITIDQFHQQHDNSFIKVDGTIADDPRQSLAIQLKGVDLSILDPFLAEAGVRQSGISTGDMIISDVLGKTAISSDLTILDYTVNDWLIGDICTESTWMPETRRLLIGGEIERDEVRSLDIGGFYSPDEKESPLDITCNFNEQSLEFLNGFITEGVSNIKGSISGAVDITGKPAEPMLEGRVNFNDASLKLDYLNTEYKLTQGARIYPDAFWLDFPIEDELGNKGFMAGTIMHDNFANWNFDVYLDVEEEPFMVLNTTEEDNSLYFGKAMVNGYVNVSGVQDNLEIDINVRSKRGTDIALPLGGSEEVTFEDFITFVDYSTPEVEEPVDLSGITMNFELDITPDARFRIIFDELVGDEITGRGLGHITMSINNLSDFNMYGDIEVTEGRYLFTLKSLINKEFQVKPGGRISWYGDPMAADIDLETVYKVNTALYDLLPDETDQYRQRIPVDLKMLLSGKLMSPSIVFDIDLPSADELTKARVDAAINSEQEMNRQAFSLLVLRRFISPPDIAKTNTNLGVGENSAELLSSQVSNWLSQISDDFDIGVNYSPGDEISNEELAVALSTQLFNERLLVSGNFGVAQAQNAGAGENPNSLIGDIRIEYKVTQDGKVRVIVYNESNQFDLVTQQSAYTQGLGIVYQQEFDDIYELFQISR